MAPRKFAPLFRFTADTEKLGVFVQRRWRDFVAWFNANAVTKDANGNLDFQNTMVPINLGDVFQPYIDWDSIGYTVSAAATWEDYTAVSITVTDPAVPVHVMVWGSADGRNATDAANLELLLRSSIDGTTGDYGVTHTTAATNRRQHVTSFQMRSFDPTADFTVKLQVQQSTAGTAKAVFDQGHLMVLVVPQ